SDAALFKMETNMTPAASAKRMEMGTPHVLTMGPMLAALRMFEETSIHALRQRSLELTSYLIEQIDTKLDGGGFSIATPRDEARRGGHVALRHARSEQLVPHLAERKIVTDFRHPDICRVAPVAMYNDHADIDAFVDAVYEWSDQ
ncbi:MAG: aminotransferase class V-fold PLP-dependent enzyme, partial [Planctomycetota bacterium]